MTAAAPVTITLAQLKAANACADQVALFESKFGDAVTVTEALALEVAADFTWACASAHLLRAAPLIEYERPATPHGTISRPATPHGTITDERSPLLSPVFTSHKEVQNDRLATDSDRAARLRFNLGC